MATRRPYGTLAIAFIFLALVASLWLIGPQADLSANLDSIVVVETATSNPGSASRAGTTPNLGESIRGVVRSMSTWLTGRAVEDEQADLGTILITDDMLLTENTTDATLPVELIEEPMVAADTGTADSPSLLATAEEDLLTIAATNVSTCTTLSSADEYFLINNISQTTGACISITADDIILDCQGYQIEFDTAASGGIGVAITGANNVTVRNCLVEAISTSGASFPITITSSNSTVVEHNTVIARGTSSQSIRALTQSHYTDVYNNTITNHGGGLSRAVSLTCSGCQSNYTVRSNTIYTNDTGSSSFITVITGLNSLIENNYIESVGQSIAVPITPIGANATVRGNHIVTTYPSASHRGIELGESNGGYSTVVNNTLNMTGSFTELGSAIGVTFGRNIVVANNTIITNGINAMVVGEQGRFTTVYGNTMYANGGYGINIADATNSTIYNNDITINGSQAQGIKVGAGIGHVMINNTIRILNGAEYIVTALATSAGQFYNTTFASAYGSIRSESNISITTGDNVTTRHIEILNNSAFVNTSLLPELNVSSRITLDGLAFSAVLPEVDYNDDGNFEVCNSPQCTYVSYNGSTFVFDVASFTTYRAAQSASCGNVSTSINLTEHLSTNGTCITLQANDVTIDCGGYNITGDDGTNDYGIDFNGYDNIVVQNCNINNFYAGIYAPTSTTNALIRNNNFSSNAIWGIRPIDLLNSRIIDNRFISNIQHIRGSMQDSIIANNTLLSGTYGVQLDSLPTLRNNITNNYFSGAGQYAIYLQSVSSNRIVNNHITGSQHAILVNSDANNNLIYNNTIGNTTNHALRVTGVTGNNISQNTLTNIGGEALYLSFGQPAGNYDNDIDTTNTIDGSPIYYSYGASNVVYQNLVAAHFSVEAANNVTIINVTSTHDPLLISRITNSTISNVTVINSSGNGYGLIVSATTNNLITNVTVRDTLDAVYVTGDTDSIIRNIQTSGTNRHGVYITQSSRTVAANLTCPTAYNRCAVLDGATNATLANSTLTSGFTGIRVTSGSGNIIENNYAITTDDFDDALILTTSTTGNIIRNNVLVTSGGTSNTDPIEFLSASNNLVENNILNGSAWGIILQGGVNNTIRYNTMYSSNSLVRINGPDNSTFIGNIFNPVGAATSGIENTDGVGHRFINNIFNDTNIWVELSSGQSVNLTNNSFYTTDGYIRLQEEVALVGTDLTRAIINLSDVVFVNTSAIAALNVSAQILEFNKASAPSTIYVDYEDDGTFEECPITVCQTVSYNATTQEYVFNVTHFTTYSTNSPTAPAISQVIINTTLGTNTSDENLTAYIIGVTGGPIENITDWRIDGTSWAQANFPLSADNGNENTTTIDFSTRSNNATVTGATFNATANRHGYGAYYFDGLTNQISAPYNASYNPTDELSVSAWISSTTDQDGRSVVSQGASVGGLYNWIVWASGGGGADTISLYVRRGTDDAIFSAGCSYANGALWDGDWFHFVGTWDRSLSTQRLKVYVNGTECGNNDAADFAVRQSAGTFDIGHQGGVSRFTGYIDEVIMWDEALSANQIAELYNSNNLVITSETFDSASTWQACVTPNNGAEFGNTTCSNTLDINLTSNLPPTISQVILNNTDPNNYTSGNLTAHIIGVDDPNGDSVKNITTWYVDNNSIIVLNMPFEGPSTSGTVGVNGSTADFSGYGNNGTVVNATWNATGGVDGKGAYEFNATGYIRMASSTSLNITGDMTIEAWIKPSNNSNSDFFQSQPIIEWNNQDTFGVNFWQHRTSTQLWASYRDDGGAPFNLETSPGVVKDGEWQHVATTLKGNTARIYHNGIVVAETTFAPYFGTINLLTDYDLYIGARPSESPGGPTIFNKTYYNGSIDDVRIWNRALTEEQIREHYLLATQNMARGNAQNGETWQACVTPNDGTQSGNEVCSNTLLVQSDQFGACINITQSGNYLLTQDIASNGTCVRITASNVNLDCDGYSISYGQDAGSNEYGIVADQGTSRLTGITIDGCTIERRVGVTGDNNYGIRLYNVSGVTITNTYINISGANTNYALYTAESHGVTADNLSVYRGEGETGAVGNFNHAIAWDTVYASSITNSYINSTAYRSGLIALNDVDNSSFTNLGLEQGPFDLAGVPIIGVVSGSDYNLFDNITFTSTQTSASAAVDSDYFFELDDASYNNITRSTSIIVSEGSVGRILAAVRAYADSTDNYIALNNFSSADGIVIGGARNIIENNSIRAKAATSNTYGIQLVTDADPGVLRNNIVRHNNIYANGTTETIGIFLFLGTNGQAVRNNLIENNTVYVTGTGTGTSNFQGQMGIALTEGFFTGGSGMTNNTIRFNDVTTDGYAISYGIAHLKLSGPFLGAGNNTFANNTIRTNSTAPTAGQSHGIYLVDIPGPTIIGNNTIIADGIDAVGVYIDQSLQVSIINNDVTSQSDALFFEGDAPTQLNTHEVTTDNVFNGRGVSYYGGTGNSPACPNGGSVNNPNVEHLALIGCTNVDVIGYDGDNLLIVNGSDHLIQSANISEKRRGVRLYFDADDITISNSVINTNGTTLTYGIQLYNNTDRTTITNTTIFTDGVATGTQSNNYGLYATINVDGTLLQDSVIRTNGAQRNYGVYIPDIAENVTLLRNDIRAEGESIDYGMYIVDVPGINLTGNTINGSSSGGYGMYVEGTSTRGYYFNNTFDSESSYGLYFNPGANLIANLSILSNRFVADGTSTIAGLRLDDNIDDADVFYNNFTSAIGILLQASTGAPERTNISHNTFNVTSYAVNLNGGPNTTISFNNITVHTAGQYREAVRASSSSSTMTMRDNRILGVTGTNAEIGLVSVQSSARAIVTDNNYTGVGIASHRFIYTGSGSLPSTFINNRARFVNANSGQDRGLYVQSNDHRFLNNTIIVNGSSSNVHGIEMTSGSNVSFVNNRFILNGSTGIDGILFGTNGENITIENSFVNVTGTTGSALNFANSNGLNFTNTYVFTNVEWMRKASPGGSNYMTNTTLGNVNGSIWWPGAINVTIPANQAIGTADFVINNSLIRANSSEYAFFNNSAQLTFDGISLSNPQIRVDLTENQFYEDCVGPRCTFVSYANNQYIVNVTGFSSYIIVQEILPPNITAVIINSSLLGNTTDEDIVATPFNVTDGNNDTVQNITNWYVDGTEINVLHLPFEAFDGPEQDYTYDYSESGRNGTVFDAVWNATGGADGFGAYTFDGVQDHIRFADDAGLRFNTSDEITINAWIRPATLPGFHVIVAKGRTNGTDRANYVLRTSGDFIEFYYRNAADDAFHIYTSSTAVDSGRWQMITAAYEFGNGSSMRIYHNGTLLLGSWTLGAGNESPYVSDEDLLIGATDFGAIGTYDSEFNGRLDRIQIYNRALSGAQIAQLMQDDKVIVANETTVGEVWRAKITTNDGIVVGGSAYSANLTILPAATNALPQITSIVLNSTLALNKTTENITAHAINVTDADNDTVKLIYNWYVDGADLLHLNMPFEGTALDEASATKDYSSNGYTGTVVGATWNQTGGYDGFGAYQFNGSHYINLTQDISPGTTDFSLETWIQNTGDAAQFYDSVIADWGEGPNFPAYQIRINFSEHPAFFVRDTDGNSLTAASPDPIAENVWNHIVATRANDTLSLYVNGELKDTVSGVLNNVNTSGSDSLLIGHQSASVAQVRFNGLIDEARMYARALSAEQVFALYANATNVIVSAETSAGQVWSVNVTPNDGRPNTDGLTVASNELTILNTIASVDAVILNSTSGANLSLDNLTAYAINITDVDGDDVESHWDWRADGRSLTVLNLPMSPEANNSIVRDLSTYANNGTTNAGALFNASGGPDGRGAYEFFGQGSHIAIPDDDSLDFNTSSAVTWEFLARFNDFDGGGHMLYAKDAAGGNGNPMIFASNGNLTFTYLNGSINPAFHTNDTPLTINTWHHIIIRYQFGNASTMSITVDGTESTGTWITGTGNEVATINTAPVYLGRRVFANTTQLNGSIAGVRVYNRSLSDLQVQLLFANVTNTITAEETVASETWQACVLPNDGMASSALVCSNTLTIVANNTAPTAPILITPQNGITNSTDRLPVYNWSNSFDADADNLTYDLEVSIVSNFSSLLLNITGINESTGYTQYNSSVPLEVDQTFYWRVRAHDGSVYGSYSNVSNFTVVSFLSAGFSAFNVSFTSLLPGQNSSTETSSANPFVIENTGNVNINISISGTPLFTSNSYTFPSSNYQYRIAENETGSFNISQSLTSYINVTNSSSTPAIVDLNWQDSADTATIHVAVDVPGDEPSGDKQSGWTLSVT